ncbi:ATP-grasp domain-containing protein [Streptomyces sp. NPDC004059]
MTALRAAVPVSGGRAWESPYDKAVPIVELAFRQARFAALLTEHGIPTPRTVLSDEIDQAPDGPLVVKPRYGQGAKDVHFCRTREQARVLCELMPHPLVQQRVKGREFTADCLVDRSGRASVVLRHRLVVKGGLAMVSVRGGQRDAGKPRSGPAATSAGSGQRLVVTLPRV